MRVPLVPRLGNNRSRKIPAEKPRFVSLNAWKPSRSPKPAKDRGILDPDQGPQFEEFQARWWPGEDIAED